MQPIRSAAKRTQLRPIEAHTMNGMRYITVTGERRRTSVWVRFSGVLRLLRCTGDCGDRRRTSLGDRRFGELGGDLRFRERLRLRLPRLRLTCRFYNNKNVALHCWRPRLVGQLLCGRCRTGAFTLLYRYDSLSLPELLSPSMYIFLKPECRHRFGSFSSTSSNFLSQ